MNNVEYALSIFEQSRKPHGIKIKNDEIAEAFSNFALKTLEESDIDSFFSIIKHPRFSPACQTLLFQFFFDNTKTKKITNFSKIFEEILEKHIFDFSLIFHNMYEQNIYIGKNTEIFNIMVKFLEKEQFYIAGVYDCYENSKHSFKKIDPIVSHYVSIAKRYRLLPCILNIDDDHVNIAYNSLEKSKKEVVSYFEDISEEDIDSIFIELHKVEDIAKLMSKKRKENVIDDIIGIISLAFGAIKIGVVGKKINHVKKGNVITCYPSEEYEIDLKAFNS